MLFAWAAFGNFADPRSRVGSTAAGPHLTSELPDAPWHRPGRPLRGCPFRLRGRWERSSGPGVSTREPVTLAIGSALAERRAECVPGEGDLEHSFCAAPAHTHMCAESHRGLSANYRLKSDREKLEGKGTAAGSWWTAEERGEGRGGVLDFVPKSSNPLPRTLKTKFNHLGVLSSLSYPPQIPTSPGRPRGPLRRGGQRSVPADNITQGFHRTSHLLPELMPFP